MASFPRIMFTSETNYVKANYLNGHSPVRKTTELTPIYKEDGTTIDHYQFNDTTSRLSLLETTDNEDLGYFDIDWDNCKYLDLTKVKLNSWMPSAFTGGKLSNNSVLEVVDMYYLSNMQGCFSNCANLKKIHIKYLLQRGVYNFDNNPNLEEIVIDDYLKSGNLWIGKAFYKNPKLHKLILNNWENSGIDLTGSEAFTREELVETINSLATVKTATTITLGSVNLAKLTDEDKEIATDKGWTLA